MAKKKKMWVLTQESNIDGEIHIGVVPCESEEIAKKQLAREKKWVLNESHHYSGFSKDEFEEAFEVEETEYRFYINDPCDDYYEEIKIDEYEVATK